jgi:predicted RNase H-like HicB family nuclease
MFEPGDNIVSDGYSLEEVLTNVKNILPLALRSRLLLREIQSS